MTCFEDIFIDTLVSKNPYKHDQIVCMLCPLWKSCYKFLYSFWVHHNMGLHGKYVRNNLDLLLTVSILAKVCVVFM